jgi:outer membrane protein TolC
LPINLATALRLADARPLLIEAAQASVQVAAGQLERAGALWLPSLYAGVDYYRHDGGAQEVMTGDLVSNSRQSLLLGPGVAAVFAVNDAVFGPLAARQVLRARAAEVQTARNNALLQVAEAYFDVQQARGRLAGALDAVARAGDLARRTRELGADLVPAVEEDRVLTLLADLEQVVASAREDWRTASAELARLLRLNATATVVPLEPPHLQVTLISPQEPVDALVPIGLTNRPELASQQALVQAALERLRQERLRPLLPSVLLTGSAGSAGGPLAGGAFATGPNSSLNQWSGRSDFTAQVVWELRNLGFGNRGLIRERQGEQYQAMVELFRVQDTVAAEIARAHAQLESAAYRVGRAEAGLRTALSSYAGNLKGLGQTIRFGELLQPVVRPQEAVAALQQLASAYRNYFTAVGDYNRTQFRLYRALGYPARLVACERPPGEPVPVQTVRPPRMASDRNLGEEARRTAPELEREARPSGMGPLRR